MKIEAESKFEPGDSVIFIGYASGHGYVTKHGVVTGVGVRPDGEVTYSIKRNSVTYEVAESRTFPSSGSGVFDFLATEDKS